jgi:5-methylcytosine-specific restriction enzyme subunit McrC
MTTTAMAEGTTGSVRVLELEEYVTLELPRDELSEAGGEQLWRQYGSKVSVEFPSVKTGGKWQLTPQGWVGYIVLSDDLHLRLKPKVPIANLFRMLEYAYRLRIHLADGLVDCATLEDFYERLAHILARRVLDRGRRGFYRTYVAESDDLPYVRGQLDTRRLISRPWETRLQCLYEEHTGDVVENQILAWTLGGIARSGLCSKRVMPTVRTAYRSIQSFVSPVPQPASACVGRLYNRLNDDYEPLHGLCRFFLEHSGPHLDTGDRAMLPFLIDMNRLFELFVAEWLREHLPKTHSIEAQEHVEIAQTGNLEFIVDLVLYDAVTNQPISVLDTKYKRPKTPDQHDIQQVVTYAVSKKCLDAALIYPLELVDGFDACVGDQVTVRAFSFELGSDLESAGQALIRKMVMPNSMASQRDCEFS